MLLLRPRQAELTLVEARCGMTHLQPFSLHGGAIGHEPLRAQSRELAALTGVLGAYLRSNSPKPRVTAQLGKGGLNFEELPSEEHIRWARDRPLEHGERRVVLAVHGQCRGMKDEIPIFRAPALADFIS